MARKPRIHYPGAVYHVMLRGNAGQEIFSDSADGTLFYQLLEEAVERYACRIHAFCLMPNHVHLAIQVGEAPLSRIMHNISFRYTRFFNRKRGVTGHLFQGRYKAILIDAESFLLELVRYIHLNPVRTYTATEAEDYPWSSHRAYLGFESLPWLTVDWLQLHFSDNPSTATAQYSAFISDGVEAGDSRAFLTGNQEGRILSDDHFVEVALYRAGEGRGHRLSMNDIVGRVCAFYQLSEEELARLGKQRHPAEARALIAWLVREQQHLSLTELGRRTRRDLASLSQAASRLERRAAQDEALADRMQSVKKELYRLTKPYR